MTRKSKSKNGIFDERSFFAKYFGFDVLDTSDLGINPIYTDGKLVSESVKTVDSKCDGTTYAYATATLAQLGVPSPHEMVVAVEDRIKHSREGISGLVLQVLELIEDPYKEDKKWVDTPEGRKLIDIAIKYYVENGIDNSILSRFNNYPYECPKNPVYTLSGIALKLALENNDFHRAYRVCYNSEDYIEGGRIAKKAGNERIAEFFFRKGYSEYPLSNCTKDLGNRKRFCAKELGLTNILRIMDLRDAVRFKRSKNYFDAGKILSRLGIDKRAKEMFELAIEDAEPIASLPEPQYYQGYWKNLDEIHKSSRFLIDGAFSAIRLGRSKKAEELISRMKGHPYYPKYLDNEYCEKAAWRDD